MKTFLKNALAALVLLIAAMFLAAPVTAQAKASNIKLDVNRTYKQYDFTGDQKPDKFRFSTASYNAYAFKSYQVSLNGNKR